MFPLVALWLSAVAFAGFGVAFLVAPVKLLSVVELRADTGTAQAEVRAMYGGLELGIAAFLAWCGVTPGQVMTGVIASAMLLIGLGAGRVLGILLAERPRPVLWAFVGLELGGGGLCAVAAAL